MYLEDVLRDFAVERGTRLVLEVGIFVCAQLQELEPEQEVITVRSYFMLELFYR